MVRPATEQFRAAEVVIACAELNAALRFFTEQLGFRLHTIVSADDPASAVITGHGVRIRLQRGADAPVHLRLRCDDPSAVAGGKTELRAPGGTHIELVEDEPPLRLPPLAQSFSVHRLDDATWGEGRAGMRYRDLIPDRQGGRFIASHIHIPRAGPVPDYVHYHNVRFQMIFCYRGWVRVVYEDQGPPFVLRAGDCVLQPPEIRHRVLESSANLEVIEIGSPARHETHVDHEMTLPTSRIDPNRRFGGQRFVRHQADAARWMPWRWSGFEYRDVGIAEATGGLASVHVVRPRRASSSPVQRHDGELLLWFVLHGALTLQLERGGPHGLCAGDCVVLPAATDHALRDCVSELELLEVRLPAAED